MHGLMIAENGIMIVVLGNLKERKNDVLQRHVVCGRSGSRDRSGVSIGAGLVSFLGRRAICTLSERNRMKIHPREWLSYIKWRIQRLFRTRRYEA